MRSLTIGWAFRLAATLLALPAMPAQAGTDDYAESLERLQRLDTRIQTIGWRLVQGNAEFCASTRPAIGLLLQDVMGYNRPGAARSALGISVDFAVQAVAGTSPAQQAGLTPNQPVTAIDRHNLSDMVRNAKAPYLRLLWAERALQSSLDANGTASLSVAGKAESVTITGTAVCQSRVTVRPSHDKAVADAKGIYIGGRFPGLAYPDDELAAAMAHELAHVLLRHPHWLSANGRKRSDIRATEREADRLMPWLLANAGYDPDAATRFMRKWGPKHGGGLFRKRTHDGWDERVEFIEAELPLVRAAIARSGDADWSVRFPRKPLD